MHILIFFFARSLLCRLQVAHIYTKLDKKKYKARMFRERQKEKESEAMNDYWNTLCA